MTERVTRSMVTFSRPFVLPGYPDELPAGADEVLAEDELLGASRPGDGRRPT